MANKDLVTTIYTDGGVRGNGKYNSVGAYAFSVNTGDNYYEYTNIERGGTNQTAELKALISALYYCVQQDIRGVIKVYSDSKYVIGCATQWMSGWRGRNYQNAKGNLKNRNLIITLDKLIQSLNAEFIMHHVKGHNDNEGNERVDTLCTLAMEDYMFKNKLL